jgi:hypothetical protein
VKISAAIMAHPDRAGSVAALLNALDRPVPVYWDRGGPPSGNGDRVWSVAREAWRMAEPDAEYHVLIQDDAVPCPDLLAGLAEALDHVEPGSLVCPYLGKGPRVPARWGQMARRADAVGAAWVRSTTLMWGVCLAAPVAVIPEMIEWCDRKARMPDDMRVGRWFQRAGRDVWYTWPSLVDHRTGPSLTKHRATERVAVRHHPGSALAVDWSAPVVTDPMVTLRRGPRSAPRGMWKADSQHVRSVTTAESRKGRHSA